MIKNANTLKKRREHIKKVVANASNSTKAVEKLAKKLFISEATVWQDLAK